MAEETIGEAPVRLTAEQLRNFIGPGYNDHVSRCRRYDHAYEVYRAAEPRGVGKKEDWESTLRVPYGEQVINTAMVNLVSGPPRAQVRPRRPQDQQTAPQMQRLLDYHAGEDHLVEKQPVFTQQALIYGITAGRNAWLYREQTRTVRRFMPTMGGPMPVEAQAKLVLRDGPTFEPWDVYDLFWEPSARDVDSARYIGLRSWLTKGEVLENTISEQNPYGIFEPAAVDQMFKGGPSGSDRTTAQERYLGGGQQKRKDRFEIIEVWRETPAGLFQTILGNKRVILLDRPTPFWHGKKPIVVTQAIPDTFELQGIPLTEQIDHLQQALWSLMNMRMDNLKLTVQRGFTYRETLPTNPRDLVVKPRYMWPVGDHDDIKAVDVPPLPQEAYREDEVLLGRMQLVSGINSYVSGSDMQSVDQNTATGVTALQDVASRLLRFYARQIAYKGTQRTFEQWGELIQQFMSAAEAVRIEGEGPDGGYDWQQVSPQEIVGNYDYDVEGTEESLSRQQERSEALQLLNAVAPFVQVPGFNLKPIVEKVAKAFDIPPGAIWQAIQQQPAAPNGQPGLPQPNGQPALPGGQPFPSQVMQAIASRAGGGPGG